MTEKRYKRHLSFVLDDYANGSDRLMTIREVIPRLNELYEENEQLKKILSISENDKIKNTYVDEKGRLIGIDYND